MSQSMPAPRAAPVTTATITMASSEMVSTSLHAGTTTAPRPAGQSHRVRHSCRGSGNGRVSVNGGRKGDYKSEPIGRQDATGREEGLSGRGVSPCMYMSVCVARPSFRDQIPRSPRAFQNLKVFFLLQARALSASCCVDCTGQILRKLLVLLNRLVRPCHKPYNL
jgi:hypothetical protein